MRRLAKHSREDNYSSLKDYQQTHVRRSTRFIVPGAGQHHLVFLGESVAPEVHEYLGWGAYLAADKAVQLAWKLESGPNASGGITEVGTSWFRWGALVKADGGSSRLTLSWSGALALDLWGLSAGFPLAKVGDTDIDVTTAESAHLMPETLYVAHDTSMDVELLADESARHRTGKGREVTLKKCSYCGRLLPIDPSRLGALAFHKHNAKKTKHQNECRACKKWRINDSFNPDRTADQLHESSVITRERKLFLRDSERLQAIKDRTGDGLRSQVWNRFERKCFRCGADVTLAGFQLDHTRPLAYLWPVDEYATCLCATCNNEKKDKFPVDFYTEAQLKRLSKITKLPLAELSKKELNGEELKRILDDLQGFARAWEPRTFFATARKIRELRPDLDIELLLEEADAELYSRLLFEYNTREEDEADNGDEGVTE